MQDANVTSYQDHHNSKEVFFSKSLHALCLNFNFGTFIASQDHKTLEQVEVVGENAKWEKNKIIQGKIQQKQLNFFLQPYKKD